MPEITLDPYYAGHAKKLTNILFDKGFLADDLAREAVDDLELFLGQYLELLGKMAAESALLLRRTRTREAVKVQENVSS